MLDNIGLVPHFFVYKVQPLFQSFKKFSIEFKIKLKQLLKAILVICSHFNLSVLITGINLFGAKIVVFALDCAFHELGEKSVYSVNCTEQTPEGEFMRYYIAAALG
ncbi:hypothetical protein EJ103_09410 [Pseudoalteromonas sp. Xi13]|nr:hypothetical protein EJ103_09410 [Pseudoalteromonas sp. Xi13]